MKVIYRLSFSLEQTKTFPYKRGSTGIKPFDCKLFRNKKWKRGDGGRGTGDGGRGTGKAYLRRPVSRYESDVRAIYFCWSDAYWIRQIKL